MKDIFKTNENECSAVACAEPNSNVERSQRVRKPNYRVEKSDDAFTLEVALPGAAKEGIEIAVERGVLTVTAARRAENPAGWNTLRRESFAGSYQLALKLNAPVDDANIKASADNGILTLILPVKEEAKAKKIAVN